MEDSTNTWENLVSFTRGKGSWDEIRLESVSSI